MDAGIWSSHRLPPYSGDAPLPIHRVPEARLGAAHHLVHQEEGEGEGEPVEESEGEVFDELHGASLLLVPQGRQLYEEAEADRGRGALVECVSERSWLILGVAGA